MIFREELDKRKIKYRREIINKSDNYFFENGIRVHIYEKSINYCDKEGLISLPPTTKSMEIILNMLEHEDKQCRSKLINHE